MFEHLYKSNILSSQAEISTFLHNHLYKYECIFLSKEANSAGGYEGTELSI